MAFSTQRVVSDGSLVLLTIDIDYFERDEIAVFFDGILDALPWAWVGSTERKISFTPAVPNGVEVLIRRSTKLDTVLHEFQLGAAFTEDSVDENFAQILRIAQEAVEGGSLGDIFNDLDMHGYKIKNTGTATDPTDVVTFQQFSTHDATIVGYRDQAAASAAAAAASASSVDTATLLNRVNHTGTQAIGTVSGLQAALDAKQAALVSGTSIKTVDGTSVLGAGNIVTLPTGASVTFTGTVAPTGYVAADGALLSRATYSALWAFAQSSGNLAASDGAWQAGQYSPGDGSTTFRVPDSRGVFIRGFDAGKGLDSGRIFGSLQSDAFKSHSHSANGWSAATTSSVYDGDIDGSYNAGGVDRNYVQNPETAAAGDVETRPVNISWLVCIKT